MRYPPPIVLGGTRAREALVVPFFSSSLVYEPLKSMSLKYEPASKPLIVQWATVVPLHPKPQPLQGYLTDKKKHPPRTLPQAYA